MLLLLAPALILLGPLDNSQLGATQVHDLIRTKTTPLTSFVFVYEGKLRYVGDPGLLKGIKPEDINEEFQGTFLYRSDGAAFYDLYKIRPAQSGGVIRKKAAVLKGRLEESSDLIDSRQRLTRDNTQSRSGSLATMNRLESPLELHAIWDLVGIYGALHHEVVGEGWEVVDGHNCLKVRASVLTTDKDVDKERDKRYYWLDLDRNGQALKVEYYNGGQLQGVIDRVRLEEFDLPGGGTYWLPVYSRQRSFALGLNILENPVTERTVSMVAGSELFNLNLPDAVFSVLRDSAYPTPKELQGVEASVKAGPLASKFGAQAALQPPRYRTDPVSVRKRIEDGLAEADRQSKELEASSPAREAWSGTTVVQVAIGVLGVGLLGFVAARKWRGG